MNINVVIVGEEANYQFKNGKWCCHQFATQCPENIKKGVIKIKNWWKKLHNLGFTNQINIPNEIKKFDLGIVGICYYCGKKANYQLKNGRWCCMPSYNQCPESRKKNSEKIKSMYSKNENGDILFNNKLRKDEYTEERLKKHGWSKGKTRYNDIRIKKLSEKLLEKYKNGEIKPSFLGKHHTEKTKLKLVKNGGYKKGGRTREARLV